MSTVEKLSSIQVKILDKRLGSTWPLPSYATAGSAAMDLTACLDEAVCLEPGKAKLVPTGIAMYIQNHDFAAKILPRSGLGHKQGVVLGNGTGLIDADYQGPLFVSCLNRGNADFHVQPGDRIAQIIFIPIVRPELEIVTDFEETTRGAGGFGSTGVRATIPE